MEELAEGAALAGRYLLGPVVGHGAMGRVHLAEDLRLARPVAVKSLRPELARYPDVRHRFGQEARAAARINHPNVVRVYDSGEHGRIPYLVMECLPGSTLVDELAWGPLEPRRARRVGLDVLGALDAAHRMGVVHRDVKPGNILLSAALDGPVKVSDFGIAKSADDRSMTDSDALVGTAAYLAPERVAGGTATPSSDLYSLGVVLYEALAGRKPYEGETSLAVALAIHLGGAPSLLELRPDLDPSLTGVIEQALARDPSERWESAAAMAAVLRAWRPDGAGRGELGATGPVVITPTGPPPVSLPGRPEPEPDAGDGAGAATSDHGAGPQDHVEPDDRSTTPIVAEPGARASPMAPEAAGGVRLLTGKDGSLAVADGAGDPTQILIPDVDTSPTTPLAPRASVPTGSPTGGVVGGAGTGRRAWGESGDVPLMRVMEGGGRGRGLPRRSRRHPWALASAGAAGLLLLGALVAMAGRRSDAPSDPVTPTTAAELVAGPASWEPVAAEAGTVAPVHSVAPTTVRTRRRAAAPASTAKLPPPTRPAPTTAAPMPPPTMATARTTVPPTTTATTVPPTAAAPAA